MKIYVIFSVYFSSKTNLYILQKENCCLAKRIIVFIFCFSKLNEINKEENISHELYLFVLLFLENIYKSWINYIKQKKRNLTKSISVVFLSPTKFKTLKRKIRIWKKIEKNNENTQKLISKCMAVAPLVVADPMLACVDNLHNFWM